MAKSTIEKAVVTLLLAALEDEDIVNKLLEIVLEADDTDVLDVEAEDDESEEEEDEEDESEDGESEEDEGLYDADELELFEKEELVEIALESFELKLSGKSAKKTMIKRILAAQEEMFLEDEEDDDVELEDEDEGEEEVAYTAVDLEGLDKEELTEIAEDMGLSVSPKSRVKTLVKKILAAQEVGEDEEEEEEEEAPPKKKARRGKVSDKGSKLDKFI